MSEHRFGEVLIERPRYKGKQGNLSSRRLPDVRRQLHEITQAAWEGDLGHAALIKVRHSKSLADHLGPLKNFLRAKVGSPWDSVYSELARKVKVNTMLGQHVMDHVRDYVETAVVIRDGQLYNSRGYSLTNRWYDRFYVHPETGLLCNAPRSPKPKCSLRTDWWGVSPHLHYRQINDIWYALTFAPMPEDLGLTEKVWDALIGESITETKAQTLYGRAYYCCRKQQCSKKQIRQIDRHFHNLLSANGLGAGVPTAG